MPMLGNVVFFSKFCLSLLFAKEIPNQVSHWLDKKIPVFFWDRFSDQLFGMVKPAVRGCSTTAFFSVILAENFILLWVGVGLVTKVTFKTFLT